MPNSVIHSTDPLLSPENLQKLGNLELIARQVVDGYLQGTHRSPHLGFAMDFARHRPYVPGDDTKRIDWRAFARSERYYIKQHEVTTNLHAHILLDASASMAYQGSADPLSKFRYAQQAAACLAYLILNQKDSVGVTTFDSRLRESLAPASSPSHLTQVLSSIERASPFNESAIGPMLHEFAGRIRGRAMLILISDLFDDASTLIHGLHHLHREGHEILVLQIMSPDELDFPFRTWTTFENLEDPPDRRRVDPAIMRASYLANLQQHLNSIRDAANRLQIRYALLNTSQPLESALTAYLSK